MCERFSVEKKNCLGKQSTDKTWKEISIVFLTDDKRTSIFKIPKYMI
jgi:hypothetical protein